MSRQQRDGADHPVRVPEATTRRLSLVLRVLTELQDEAVKTVSSRGIADRARLNPAQVRKDLAYFGAFGMRGVGYDVAELRQIIAGILGLDRRVGAIIVGAGNLGSALGDYPGFGASGFEIVALFDVDETKVGRRTRTGVAVEHLDRLAEVIEVHDVEIAIIAVPAEAAQQVVDRLADAGIHAILNFAPSRPEAPEQILLRHVDLKVELESLSFFLQRSDGPSPPA